MANESSSIRMEIFLNSICRNLKAVAEHKVGDFRQYLPLACPSAHTLILDSEVVLFDLHSGLTLLFGSLGIHKKKAFEDATMCLYVFDILLLNGKCLMDTPMS